MDNILKIENIHKSYGKGKKKIFANAGIDLTVKQGEVVGLLGHNGAGKSTLVNQIVGLAKPDSGDILLGGVDAIKNPDVARRLASVQAQANVPITGLTPRTAIELVGKIRGGNKTEVKERTKYLLKALDLNDWADVPSQKVSGGISRLTAFAMTAVVPGQLVVLDEPTNDVDPVRRRLLWNEIRKLADDGAGVLLVTHNVREAERVVDRLIILDHGVVLADDNPANLTNQYSGSLTIEIDANSSEEIITPVGIDLTNKGHGRFTAKVKASSAAEIVEWASTQMELRKIERYALVPVSLEDVYIEMVEQEYVLENE